MANFDSDLIDEYLLGRMNPEEKAAFEQTLKEDKAMAIEVEQRKQSILAIEVLGDHALKARVQQVHDKNVPLIFGRQKQKKLLYLGLLVFIVLAFILFFWSQKQQVRPQKIFADNFAAYPLSFGQRGENTELKILRFSDLYQEGAYSDALSAIDGLADSLLDSKLRLAKAIAQLSSQQYTEAEENFRQLVTGQDPIYEEQARWYLALALLQNERLIDSKQLFQEIQNHQGHYKQQEAIKILEKLNK